LRDTVYNGAQMESSCKECEKIATDYREAVLEFWRNASEETRAACRATANLVSCTESDARDAQRQLRPFTREEMTRPPSEFQVRISSAMFRKYRHQQQTGHRVNLRTGGQ
jgi:hypothetical protein